MSDNFDSNIGAQCFINTETHLKSTIYRHDLKNAMPFWLGCTTDDVIGTAHQHYE